MMQNKSCFSISIVGKETVGGHYLDKIKIKKSLIKEYIISCRNDIKKVATFKKKL
jgi:hypothetical protein